MLDREHARIGWRGPHAVQGARAGRRPQLGHGQGDRDVLLERDPAEAAISWSVTDSGSTAISRQLRWSASCCRIVQPLPLGGDADAADRHRPAQRRATSSRVGPISARWSSRTLHSTPMVDRISLRLVDLLQRGHRPPCTRSPARPGGSGGPAHDADLLDHVGDAELAVDRLLAWRPGR